MYALILAAGFGSRLGHDLPKALIEWKDGCIIDMQLQRIRAAGIQEIWVVTGFQSERVEAHLASEEGIHFVENKDYMDTQNGKSMLMGLKDIPPGPVVTLNADVIFDDGIIQEIIRDPSVSKLAVDAKVCGAEEMKYTTLNGHVTALSKEVHGEGEAVGINFVSAEDRALYERALEYIDDQQYFERAIDHMLPFTEKPMTVVDVGDRRAMEVDFPEDLEDARDLFKA